MLVREDPELIFEDWLPELQLAGHLHGCVLQEWNLLDEEEI